MIVAAMIAMVVPATAWADRVVDYTIDEATAAHDAIEQGVPLAPVPARGDAHVAVQIAPEVDHQVVRVGIFCSAWKVQNPISILIQRFLAAWDRDGAPSSSPSGPADLLVKVDRASTLSRCVGTGELKTTCITRVSIDGSIARKSEAARAFHVEREEATKGIGACAGLTRGIALVSRDAASALIGQLGGTSPASR